MVPAVPKFLLPVTGAPEASTVRAAEAVVWLHTVDPVDIFVPGCPPDADTIFYVLSELAQGRRPDIKGDKNQWQ